MIFFTPSNGEMQKWDSRSPRRFLSSRTNDLVFNRNRRWRGPSNYSFLMDVASKIKSLTITDYNPLVDIRILEQLDLTELNLEVGQKCSWPSRLPRSLRSLTVQLSSGCPSVTELPELKTLRIWGKCNWETLPTFESEKLEKLDVDAPRLKHLSSVEMPFLRKLTISGPKDLCLDNIHNSLGLEELNLWDMRGIVNLTPVSQLGSLRRFSLDGSKVHTPTVYPILKCDLLSWVSLGGTTVDDGDLDSLGSLPNLKEIGFSNQRKHNIPLREFLKKYNVSRIGIEI